MMSMRLRYLRKIKRISAGKTNSLYIVDTVLVGLRCLTQLSTIFQIYCGSQDDVNETEVFAEK
jgi:hypothetical protein